MNIDTYCVVKCLNNTNNYTIIAKDLNHDDAYKIYNRFNKSLNIKGIYFFVWGRLHSGEINLLSDLELCNILNN